MEDIFDGADFLDHGDSIAQASNKPPFVKSEFKAWHKPRKQFIRKKQWWSNFHKEFERLADVEKLKYFGLPGGDLLDLDYFSTKLQASKFNKTPLFAYGLIDNFEDKASADSRLSELTDRDSFDNASKVDMYDFESISESSSVAWKKIQGFGPYHFINLDFCNTLFTEKLLLAMNRLVDNQINRLTAEPWLFCVTTRIDRERVDFKVAQALDSILDALREKEAVWAEIQSCYEETCKALEDEGEGSLCSEQLPEKDYSDLLIICFVMSVILKAHAANVRVRLVKPFKYHVYEGNAFPDMYSFVFSFVKDDQPVEDPLPLVRVRMQGKQLLTPDTKLDCQCTAIRTISKSLDVDLHLQNPANLNVLNECIEEKKHLLKNAGWDVASYVQVMCP